MSRNTNPNLPPEQIPPGGKEYRLSRDNPWIAIGGMVLFTGMGIYSVYAAWYNVDRSFKYPMQEAVFYGAWWAFMDLIGVYVIACYFIERLYISPDILRLTGCFRTRDVRFSEVNRVVWKSTTQQNVNTPPMGGQGKVALYTTSGKITVNFRNYGRNPRMELIQYFRQALAGRPQEGWERFEETYNVGIRPASASSHKSGTTQASALYAHHGQLYDRQTGSWGMTRSEYRAYSDRTRKAILICFCGAWVMLFVITLAVGLLPSPENREASKRQLETLFQHFPQLPHSVIPDVMMLIIFSPVLVGPVLFYFLVNRFWGLHCPRCRRNVTSRCSTEAVLRRGECPFCKEKLFGDGDDAK